jgi:pyrroloquinoline quinone biosynthesis protein E
MNFGVGESGLHPEFPAVVRMLARRGIRSSVTSNGLSIAGLSAQDLRLLHSVELSLDFPTEAEHDAFRGPGNWRLVDAALARCRDAGIPAGIVVVLMRPNASRLPEMLEVARRRSAYLRINVFQPVHRPDLALDFEGFWQAFRELASCSRLVATNEPVLAGVLAPGRRHGPVCGGSTVRVTPDGRVAACTYLRDSALTLDELRARGAAILQSPAFTAPRAVPAACADCACGGGCAGRRALMVAPGQADPYCPFARGVAIDLRWERATGLDLPKAGSACTTVVLPL